MLSNTLGAGLGSWLHARIAAHLDGRLVRGLALELPLMNVVYLLVPLLWLDGFAAGHDAQRLVLSPLLGLAGAIVLAAVWRHRLAERGVLSPPRLAWLAAGWYVVGAAPGLIRRPLLVLGGAGLVAVVAWLEAARATPLVPERRFELPTLRRVWPLLVGYLIVSAFWPLPLDAGVVARAAGVSRASPTCPESSPCCARWSIWAPSPCSAIRWRSRAGGARSARAIAWRGWPSRASSPPRCWNCSAGSILRTAPVASSSSSPARWASMAGSSTGCSSGWCARRRHARPLIG